MTLTATSASIPPDSLESGPLPDQSGKSVLVTGGAGFIGGHLVQQLKKLGCTVRVLDLRPSPDPDVISIVGSITDAKDIARATAGVDTVFHLAARVKDDGTDADFWPANVIATERLLNGAREHNVHRFVLMSSLAATDYRRYAPDQREMEIASTTAMGAYGRSKQAAEIATAEAHGNSLTTTIVRPGLVPFGPQDHTSLAPLADAVKKRIPLIIGDGTNCFNTAYAPELARGLTMAGLHEAGAGEVFHIADNNRISWNQWYEEMALCLETRLSRIRWPKSLILALADPVERISGLLRVAPPLTEYRALVSTLSVHISTRKAQQKIGFVSTTEWRAALAASLDWYKRDAQR